MSYSILDQDKKQDLNYKTCVSFRKQYIHNNRNEFCYKLEIRTNFLYYWLIKYII